MFRFTKTLIIILALLFGPEFVKAQLIYTPLNLIGEKEVISKLFSSPSPINIEEVQTAIQYPDAAQEAGLEGMVVCKVLVNDNGKYVRHRVIESPDKSLGDAVSPHLARLRFVPAVKNDQPVAVWTTVRFAFKLTEDFSTPKPGTGVQAQVWEQAAEAQLEAGAYDQALELYEKAILLQKGRAPNELLNKAAKAAILAQDYSQARVHLTNLLYQTNNVSEKARILYLRALNAEARGKPGLSAKDHAFVDILSPGFIPDERDLALFSMLAKK